MKGPSVKPVRCAIYTRVSTDHGLDQEFNSLDAQYDAASAYIKSQAHAGWALIRSRYDDGGYSGGSTDRPDLQRLLDDIRARKIDVIVVYKVDRPIVRPTSPTRPRSSLQRRPRFSGRMSICAIWQSAGKNCL
jgi:site-specific DNA recombinase